MDANAILVFARVVDAGSFVGASRELDMPTSTVSRKVSGVALAGRPDPRRLPSTRHLSPTVKTILDHLQSEMSPPP